MFSLHVLERVQTHGDEDNGYQNKIEICQEFAEVLRCWFNTGSLIDGESHRAKQNSNGTTHLDERIARNRQSNASYVS